MANAIEIALSLQDQLSNGLRAANKSLSEFASNAKAGTLDAVQLGVAFGGLTTAMATAVGAVTVWQERMSGMVEGLDNASAAAGVNAQQMQVLQFAFKQGGVDAAALSQGMNFLQRAIASNDPALAKLGVTSRDSFEAFQQAAKGIAGMTDSNDAAAASFQVFGKGAGQMLPILKQVAEDFDGISQKARETGNVLSELALTQLRDVDSQFDRMSATFDGFNKRIAVSAAGPFLTVIKFINDSYDAWNKLSRMSNFIRWYAETFMGAKAGGPNVIEGTGADAAARSFGPGNDDGVKAFEAAMKQAEDLKKEYAALAQARYDAIFGGPSQAPQNRINQPTVGVGRLADSGIIEQAERAHEHMTRLADDMRRTMDDVGRNIQGTLMGVFMNITNSAQTFRGAMATIFQGVRDAVLQAIFEIVSAQITAAFFKILGFALTAIGLPGLGAVAGAAGASMGGNVIATGGAPVSGMAPTGGGGSTYVIQTFNAKDTLSQLVSGGGSFRRANDRLAEVGAAS